MGGARAAEGEEEVSMGCGADGAEEEERATCGVGIAPIGVKKRKYIR